MSDNRPATANSGNTPSRLQRFWDFAARNEKKHPDYTVLDVMGNAIRVVSDGKLEARLAEYKEYQKLSNEPSKAKNLAEYMDELMDMLKMTNDCVQRIAGPYASGGDEAKGAKLMMGWSKLHFNAMSRAVRTKHFWGSSEIKIDSDTVDEINVMNFALSLQHHYLPWAAAVINFCFKQADVRERSVTYIQTMSPFAQRGEGIGEGKPPEETY